MSTLHLPPELTIYTVAELHRLWMTWVGETTTPGTETVAVDGSAVNEVDAAGLQLLMSLANMLAAKGLRLQVLGTSHVLKTSLQALGLDSLIDQVPASEPVEAGALA